MDGFRRILRFVLRGARRLVVFVVGVAIVVLGLVLVPLPGPGWAIVFAGLALLATEFAWAKFALDRAKRQLARFAQKAREATSRTKAPPAEDVGSDDGAPAVTGSDPAPPPPRPEPATPPRPQPAAHPDEPARR